MIVIPSVCSLLLFSTLKWFKEKYIDHKVIYLHNKHLDELYNLLWYQTMEQKIWVYGYEDIDTWHLNTIEQTFQSMYKQFNQPLNKNWKIVVEHSAQVQLYNSIVDKDHFLITSFIEITPEQLIQFSQENSLTLEETKVLFIALLHLTTTEIVEDTQGAHISQSIIKSWYSRVDMRANIWGVLWSCKDYKQGSFILPIRSDRLIQIVQQLQKKYHKIYGNSLFYAIKKDIWFQWGVSKTKFK